MLVEHPKVIEITKGETKDLNYYDFRRPCSENKCGNLFYDFRLSKVSAVNFQPSGAWKIQVSLIATTLLLHRRVANAFYGAGSGRKNHMSSDESIYCCTGFFTIPH